MSEREQVVIHSSSVSVDGASIEVRDAGGLLSFHRSSRGGPVAMLRGDRLTWINDHAAYGDFTEDKRGWVEKFYFGPPEPDYSCAHCGDPYGH